MSVQLFDESQSETGEENYAEAQFRKNPGDSDNLILRITSGLLYLLILTVGGGAVINYIQGKPFPAGLMVIGLTVIGLLFGFSYLLKSKNRQEKN